MVKTIIIGFLVINANFAFASDAKNPCAVSNEIKRVSKIDCEKLKTELRSFFIGKQNYILGNPGWANLKNKDKTDLLSQIGIYTKSVEDCLAKQMIDQEELDLVDLHLEMSSLKSTMKFYIDNNVSKLTDSFIESYNKIMNLLE